MDKREKEINEYLENWVYPYYYKWIGFYRDVNLNKQSFRAQMKCADSLLDFLDNIIGNLEGNFEKGEGQTIIPTCFPSIERFMEWLSWMKRMMNQNMPLIEKNRIPDSPNYYVDNLSQMVWEFLGMIERCEKTYLLDTDIPAPYCEIRRLLIREDVKGVISILKSILTSIPSTIRKDKYNEGHFHIAVHSIMSVLGFDVISEMSTSIGRIDMAIRISNLAYIFEFKYAPKRPSARKGFEQIVNKVYFESLKLQSRKVIGVGVAFSGEAKNIVDFHSETLYEKEDK